MNSERHQTGSLAAGQNDAQAPPTELNSIDKQLIELRSQISDLGYEVDLYKTGIAASMGGGIFLLLLAAGAGYDLITGRESIWSPIGVTHDLLMFIAWALGVAGVVLLIQGFARQRRRDRDRENRLAELERRYSRLLDDQDAISEDRL